MEGIRLVGLAQDDPAVPATGSGAAAHYLFDALARRHQLVARCGVEFGPLTRAALAARSIHPDRERWRRRFAWPGLAAIDARSLVARRTLAQLDQPFDLVFQIYGLFRTADAPFVIYVDNTIELSRRHWPSWVPLEGRQLARVYEWERRLYNDAEHVFTMGSRAAESVTGFYGAAADRVTTVGAGANFEPLPPRTARSAGERPAEILFVGGDWVRKGGPTLIEAFRIVRRKHPAARLTIVGTDLAPSTEPGVAVLGHLRDRERLGALYAGARCFCLPSVFEPYGFVLPEAMAHSTPCVVTRVGAFDEIVIDGESGIVVPSADADALGVALSRVLDDDELATSMGDAARRRVEDELNWDATIDRIDPHLASISARLGL